MFTPTIVVTMILKDFSTDCDKKIIHVENTCRKMFLRYEKLDKAFGNFFLALFSTTQFIVVLMTFLRDGFIKDIELLFQKKALKMHSIKNIQYIDLLKPLFSAFLGFLLKEIMFRNFLYFSHTCLWFVFMLQI